MQNYQTALGKSNKKKKNVSRQLVKTNKRLAEQGESPAELEEQRQCSLGIITSLKADLAETKKHLAAAKAGKQAGHRQKLTFKRKFQATLQQVTKLKQKIAVFKHKAVTQQRKDKVSTDDTGKRRAKVITTLEGRPPRYNDAICFCCIRLLSHNIGVRHVSDGIKCVVVTLTDLLIDRLPSPSKMCDFLAESKQLVLTQIGEQMMNADNLTMHRGGTSKQDQKYYTAQLATTTKTLTLGLTPVKSGSAEHSLDAVLDMLQDVENVCRNAGSGEPVAKRVLSYVRNTMTDRSSMEKSCNKLLNSYMSRILPDIVDGWSELPDSAQQTMLTVNHFFLRVTIYCGAC